MDLYNATFIIITILRLVLPTLIIPFPILGTFLAIFGDNIDYFSFILQSEEEKLSYQIWDKALDTYYLTFLLYLSLSWKDKLASKLSKIFYIYRVIGVVLLFITSTEVILFLFPNFFETFIIFYYLYIIFTRDQILFKNKNEFLQILFVIIVPKLIFEYMLHGGQPGISQIYFYILTIFPYLFLIYKILKFKYEPRF